MVNPIELRSNESRPASAYFNASRKRRAWA